MKSGDRATLRPVRMLGAAAGWAAVPRLVAGIRYPAAAGPAETAREDPLPVSGRRASGVVMVCASISVGGR